MFSATSSTRAHRVSRSLLAAAVTGSILLIGALVLQRYVATTRTDAIVMVAAWYGAVGIGAITLAVIRSRRRLAPLATWVIVVLATVAIGYWTGFRDRRVDEDVIVARSQAGAEVQRAALSGEARSDGTTSGSSARRPVAIASGMFVGQDGHSGTGVATVVANARGERTLTFTRFDVDPGLDVAVYLTSTTDSVDDRVDLGALKGNIGDQQYLIPPEVDLGKYDSVILWCRPFTVRIATAELS
jgi:Electron transfer DM13